MFTFCRLPRHTVENNVNTNDLYLVAVVEKNKHKGQSISVRVLYHKQKKHFFFRKTGFYYPVPQRDITAFTSIATSGSRTATAIILQIVVSYQHQVPTSSS
jgi:hypothetical protein